MSDTHQAEGVPAAEQEVPDAPDQAQSAPAGREGEARADPQPEPKPEREPWFVKRIAELTREKADRERVLAQAERKLRELQPQPDPDAPPDPRNSQSEFAVNALAEQRAAQMLAEREYNQACNASHAAGVAAYPDFGEAMQQLAASGGIPRPLIEAALETGEAHKVLYQLGRNPEEAMRISGLTPARMGVALAKLAAKPVQPPAVTRAPNPVRSIGGGSTRPAEDPERMSMAEFSAWREKQERAKRAG